MESLPLLLSTNTRILKTKKSTGTPYSMSYTSYQGSFFFRHCPKGIALHKPSWFHTQEEKNLVYCADSKAVPGLKVVMTPFSPSDVKSVEALRRNLSTSVSFSATMVISQLAV